MRRNILYFVLVFKKLEPHEKPEIVYPFCFRFYDWIQKNLHKIILFLL